MGRVERRGARRRLVCSFLLGPAAVVSCAAPRPSLEDLVFCATAASGPGGPDAERVARRIAELAPSGPLDFVLLPGDNFAPGGVSSTRDPQWQSKFERLFDPSALAVPFFAALGEADHRGDLRAQIDYGVFNARWTLDDHTYHFVERSHGETFTFVALDSPSLLGPLGVARNRRASRWVSDTLRAVEGGWKIVFGHHPAFAGAPSKMAERDVGAWLADLGVDVYIAGGTSVLDVTVAPSGVVQVRAGTAGFAWFRYDGEALEIVLRDAAGRVVGRHRITGPPCAGSVPSRTARGAASRAGPTVGAASPPAAERRSEP